jgi:excisionase family DNA binding protein
MAGQFRDEQIASTLNRLGMRTGEGNTWNEGRVYSLRHYHQMPAYDATGLPAGILTLEQAAGRLGVSPRVVRHLIHRKAIPATQVVQGAPWQIPAAAVEAPEVRQAAMDLKNRRRPSRPQFRDECTLELTGFSGSGASVGELPSDDHSPAIHTPALQDGPADLSSDEEGSRTAT